MNGYADATEPYATLDVAGTKLLAFSGDAKTLAVTDSSGNIQLWDVAAGSRFDTIETRGRGPIAMQWRDDDTLVSCGSDNSVCFWDTGPEKQLLKTFDLPGAHLTNGAFSADGSMLAVTGDNVSRVIDTSSGRATTMVALRDSQFLMISEEGHYVGSPRVERLFVYVVQTDEGQEMLTPDEFAAKYGWQNNPDVVKRPWNEKSKL